MFYFTDQSEIFFFVFYFFYQHFHLPVFLSSLKLLAIPNFFSGIICGPLWGSFVVLGSFAVQFGDHLRSRIICGAVQVFSSPTVGQQLADCWWTGYRQWANSQLRGAALHNYPNNLPPIWCWSLIVNSVLYHRFALCDNKLLCVHTCGLWLKCKQFEQINYKQL